MHPLVVTAAFLANLLSTLTISTGRRHRPTSLKLARTLPTTLSLLTCICGAANAASVAPTQLNLYTLEWPPYSTANKEHQNGDGISIDIVTELMHRSGKSSTAPLFVPWARALAIAELQANSCVVPVARTRERESKYQWIGPIGQSKWAFFARSGDHLAINHLDEARPYRIGTIIGDLSVSYLQEKQMQLDLTTSEDLNIKKLEAKRIDLWSSALLPGLEFLRENKVGDIKPIFTYLKVDLYLACQRTMDKGEVARLNDILKGMYLDGTIKGIYGRSGYEGEWKNFGQR